MTTDLIARGLGATNADLGGANPLLADWHILIRNASGDIINEIGSWLSLTAIPTFNGVGPFEIEIPPTGVSARTINETCGIVITRNDVVVYSGQIRKFTRTGNGITCSGLSDEWLLMRPALPDPLGPPFTTPYNVVTGQASFVLRQLAFNNLALPYCRPDRVVSNLLIPADPGLGGTITGRGDGGPLLSILAKLASTPGAGGLGFKIRQTSATSSFLTFSIYAPADKSADVQFSVDYGTASNYEDTKEAPPATFHYVMADDGQGLDKRTIYYGGNPTHIFNWGLIEAFYDAHGVTDPTELATRLQSLVYGSTPSRTIKVDPFQTTSQQFVDHWNVGDVVTFVGPDGVPFPEVIRSARIEFTQNRGFIVTPMLGEAGSTDDTVTQQHLSSLQARVGGLEQNWRVPDNSVTRAMLTDFVKPPVGQVVPFAGTTPPTGWLLCQGQSLLRTSYPDLFGVIGGAYGVADGLHFNLPDARGRVILGVSGSHALGTSGGSETATPPPHTHPGSHSHGVGTIAIAHDHSGPAHTHPGSHSHGMNNHNHLTDINHDHPSQVIHSGIVQEAGSGGGADLDTTVTLTHAGTDRVARQFHTHDVTVDISALGSAPIASGNQSSGGNSTQNDSNVFAATFTANTGAAANITNSGTTDPDSNAYAANYGGGTLATLPPFVVMNYIIFANAA